MKIQYLYLCNDGNGSATVEANSPAEAAQKFVLDGDWGEVESTGWIDVWVTLPNGTHERHTVTIDPPEPYCPEGEHSWESPHSVVGGVRENPGVYGHGGGVVITEVCRHCGCYRRTDTWAQRPDTGKQGLQSVTYGKADEKSMRWVELKG